MISMSVWRVRSNQGFGAQGTQMDGRYAAGTFTTFGPEGEAAQITLQRVTGVYAATEPCRSECVVGNMWTNARLCAQVFDR